MRPPAGPEAASEAQVTVHGQGPGVGLVMPGYATQYGPFSGISPGSNQAAWALSRAGQPAPQRTARPRLVTHASARIGNSGSQAYRRSALGHPAHPATYQVPSFPSPSPRITSCPSPLTTEVS